MGDLFSTNESQILDHGQGLYQIKSLGDYPSLIKDIEQLAKQSRFRHMMTPMGHPTVVSMLNCGQYGWISNKSGYGYSPIDPLTEKPWPAIPASFLNLCQQTIDMLQLKAFEPDACLINRYEIGMSMGRHQDRDEQNFSHPIVSVSLGLSAIFQVFGSSRQGKAKEFLLENGDVFILSGEARKFYHGIKTIKADPINPNSLLRYNLTFRRYQK